MFLAASEGSQLVLHFILVRSFRDSWHGVASTTIREVGQKYRIIGGGRRWSGGTSAMTAWGKS